MGCDHSEGDSHRGVALFIGTFVSLMALTALLQYVGSVRAAESSSAPAASARTVSAPHLAADGWLLRSVEATGRHSGNDAHHGFGIGAVNSGNSSFFLPEVFYGSGGTAAMSVAVADLNGDGKPDSVVANQCGGGFCDKGGGHGEGTLGVLLGTGGGKFGQVGIYDSGGCNAWSVAVGDLNGDGKSDVAVLNRYSGSDCSGPSLVGVFLGNGNGTFQPLVSVLCQGNVSGIVTVGDLNRDGKPDLLVGTGFGGVGVLLGNGDGTFQPWTTYRGAGLSAATSIVVADLNGDGNPDIAVSSFDHPPNLAVLLGNGDGTFRPAVTYDAGGEFSTSVAVGDVNGDGKPDLVAGNYCANPNCVGNSVVGVLLGNGDGTFQPPGVFDAGGTLTTSLALADINGDGKLDILVPSFAGLTAGTTSLLMSNGDGTFQSPSTFKFSASGLTVADLNGDGRPDLLAATGGGFIGVSLKIVRATATVVTTSGSPSFVGQSVTFTATVTSKFGTIPDGEVVTFYDGTMPLSSVGLAGGTAAYTISTLSAKTHTIKATYSGDVTFKPSTGKVTQVVAKYPTTTTLTSSPNPSADGQRVTFTATVTPTGPYALTGKVKFWDGTIGIGSATLTGGVAKLTKSTLAVGTHPITAQYLGDAANDKSTSPVVNQVVQ
jgi:Bacterial Ig-like domain (group 3)/FG-GAP-like repeat